MDFHLLNQLFIQINDTGATGGQVHRRDAVCAEVFWGHMVKFELDKLATEARRFLWGLHCEIWGIATAHLFPAKRNTENG